MLKARRLLALFLCVWSSSLEAGAQDQRTQIYGDAIRLVTEQYFASFTSRNPDMVMSFWNVESPDFRARKVALQQLFSATGTVEIRDLHVGRISWGLWNIGTAIVRVSLDLRSVDPRTGKPSAGFGAWDKTLRLAAEGGSWNVWSELDAAQDVDALDVFEQRLTQAESAGDPTGVAEALMAIGDIHRAKGDHARAMEYYQRSLPAPRALINIGALFADQGDYAQALSYYEKAFTTPRTSGQADERARALTGIADVHRLQGQSVRAFSLYEEALALTRASGQAAQEAVVLHHIGRHHFHERRFADALNYYSRALTLEEETRSTQARLPRLLLDIARVHLAEGRHSEALLVCGRAHDAGARSDYLSEMSEARYLASQIRRALGDSYSEKARTNPVAERARKLEFGKSRIDLEVALETTEVERVHLAGGEEQVQRFMEGRVQPYYERIRLEVDSGDFASALTYAERSKGRVVLDVLQRGRPDVRTLMTPIQRQEDERLSQELVSLNSAIAAEREKPQRDVGRLARLQADLERSRLDREAFRTGVLAAAPALRAQRAIASSIDLASVAGLFLDRASVFLEYVTTQDRTYLFVITPGADPTVAQPALTVHEISIAQPALADRVERYRQKIANADLEFRADGRALFDMLLGPAQDQLRGKASIVIVPDGVLWDLPFQALQSPGQRYVIQDHAVSYAPSLSILREFTKLERQPVDRTGATTLLAFGNPAVSKQTSQRVQAVFMDESLEALPEAEKQVEELRRLYGPAQSRVYVGAEAREERAKSEAPGFRILQFATHGILNSTHPMYSHLVLAQRPGSAALGDANEDGLLEAWEIMDMKLNADLVVLAACETARGRVGAGEGMIGMAWAFFVAGAPTTVASQWKVESASTTELMLEFHRNLKTRIDNPKAAMSKAKAMQLAAQKLLKSRDYQHPFYWAGFVVIGDAR